MESLINELAELILKKFFINLYNIYIILVTLINLYNFIKIISIIKQETEIKKEKEKHIKTIVLNCIEEYINIIDKDNLILIEKQNKQIAILRNGIIKLNEKLNNNYDIII